MNRNRVAYELRNFFNNRPLCLISTLIGIKDIGLGLGFIFGLYEIQRTLLYQNYDELIPGMSGYIAGGLFLVTGLITVITAIWDKIEITRIGLRVSAFVWLFSGIMYASDGNWILAVALGFVFSALAGYLAYYYKYAPMWRENKRKLREQYGLDVKPQL